VSGYRLKDGGALIDRSGEIRFCVDGQDVVALSGDTLASALFASGRMTVARSSRYRRPRGVTGAGGDLDTAWIAAQADAELTVSARESGVELRRRTGSASRLAAILSRARALLAPRRVADRAAAFTRPDCQGGSTLEMDCDVAVVGTGPAGLMAARIAADAGLRVLLIDEDRQAGGRLFETFGRLDGAFPHVWGQAVARDLAARDGVTLLQGACVRRTTGDGFLLAVGCGRSAGLEWRIVARHVVWAAGARERSLIFAGNDLPGVLTASAGLALARRHGVAVGRKVVVFANNDGGLRTALALDDAGVFVKAVVDMRTRPDAALVAALAARGIRLEAGAVVAAARGRRAIKGVDIRGFDPHSGRLGPNVMHPSCDALLVSGGWCPRLPPEGAERTSAAFYDRLNAFVPGKAAPGWTVCGAALGELGLAECLESGRAAGLAAARACGREPGEVPACPQVESGEPADYPLGTVEVPAHGRGKRFHRPVPRCHGRGSGKGRADRFCGARRRAPYRLARVGDVAGRTGEPRCACRSGAASRLPGFSA
jgi:NADPH-dependent 2,4-dienoyl-CoA reductase/sulfur reductase-like enzyme